MDVQIWLQFIVHRWANCYGNILKGRIYSRDLVASDLTFISRGQLNLLRNFSQSVFLSHALVISSHVVWIFRYQRRGVAASAARP